MERRSWPWRRKSSEKTVPVSAPSSRSSSQPAFSGSQQALSSQHAFSIQPTIQALASKRDNLSAALHAELQETTKNSAEEDRVLEAVAQRQHAEEKVAILTEKLAASMSELAEKKEMIKQQFKVSQEALSGSEKAKAEITSLKQQLEVCLQQKTAAESRVNHLDEAFKDCVRQVRHLREEQEQRIQDAVMKKNQEWDSVRTELDAKQADLARQVLEAEAERSAMAKSLQERAKAILEVTEAKAKAEAELKVLQVRVESLEKEISSLKYEIHVLSKELQIRNEEMEYTKKSANAAHRQHLENVKKIAKLESECQRLRALVRKKLQGPAAMAQLKMEVDAFGREPWEIKRRRPVSKNGSAPFEGCQERSARVSVTNKEVQMLTERLLAMEEETSLLKEALTKRNQELHAARQMCARAASKLATVEEASPKVSGSKTDLQIDGLSTEELSLASRSEDGGHNDDEVSCAESWASALIAELAYFKKDKRLPSSRQSLESCSFGNVDDAVEYADNEGLDEYQNLDIQSFYQISKRVSRKLSIAEENLNSLKVTSPEVSMSQLQESLDWVHEAHEGVSRLNKMLHNLTTTVSPLHSTLKFQVDTPRSCFSDSASNALLDGNHNLQDPIEPMNSQAKDLLSASRTSSLNYLMCKIIQLIESLAPLVIERVKVEGMMDGTTNESHSKVMLGTGYEKQMHALISIKEKIPQGKLDIMEYLLKIALVLSSLSGLDSYEIESALTKLGASSTAEVVEKSVVGYSIQGGDLGKGTDKYNPSDGPQEEEIDSQKTRSDKPSLEWDTVVSSLQRDLENVRQDKVAVEKKLNAAEEEVSNIKSKLVETEAFVSELQQKVGSIQESKEQVERDLADASASKNDIAIQLEDAKTEISQLSSKVTSLMEGLEDKQKQYKDTVAKCENLEEQLKEFMGRSAVEAAKENEVSREDKEWYRKEQEVAAAKEKLAECQRTILVLGQQLNGLTNISDSADRSFGSSMDSRFPIDNKMVSHVEEDVHRLNALIEMEKRKAAQSSMLWPKSDRRLIEHGNNKLQGHIYYHPQPHFSNSHMMNYHPDIVHKGNGLHTPMEECSERSSMFLHSPPDTAMSSPARSPARMIQYNQKRSSKNGVRMNLTKSMNKVASSNDTKPSKSSSSLSRLFSRNKHHH